MVFFSHILRVLNALIDGVHRHPRTTLSVVFLTVIAASAGVLRLEMRMDGQAMVPRNDPAVLFDRTVRETFGIRDPLVILVESQYPDGIYHPLILRRLIDVTDAVRGLPGVSDEHIVSLATERRDRVYPKTLNFRPFLDPFPDTETLLERLAEDIDAAGPLVDGTLISRDRRAAAVMVGVPGVDEMGDRGSLYREIEKRLEPLDDEHVDLSVVGAPAAEALLGMHILRDLALLLPLAIVTMSVLLLWRLGRMWGVLIGLIEVGTCLLFTFGLMGWSGVPLTLTSGVLPLVVISLCLADEIHIFTHYQRLLDRDGSETQPVVQAMAEMLPPVLTTTLTTSLGFLSFTFSEIEPIRQFGLFAAVGTLSGLLFSITAIPAALTLLPVERLRRKPAVQNSGDRLLAPVFFALNRPHATLLTLLALTLCCSFGYRDLVVQDSWIEGFAPPSQFRRDTDRVNAQLLGTHILLVHLQVARDGEPPEGGDRKGWLIDPELLDGLGNFENYLNSLPGVGGVLGPHSHLSTVAHLLQARQPGTRTIPDHVAQVAQVYHFFDTVRGKQRRREVVHDDLDRALITVFLKNANYQETKRLIETMRRWDGFRNLRTFQNYRVQLSFAGDVAISQAMIPAIVRSQITSLLLALGGAFMALVLLLGSGRMALVAILPTALAVSCMFGAMGWLGIPLGVATSMFCAITLGIGVDYAIHLMAANRRALARGVEDPVGTALDEAGPPIITDFAVMGLSFAWLLLSQVQANVRLGYLVALALGFSCLFTLVGLAAILRIRRMH